MTNEPPSPTVAYVMTHYPRVALSFLSGEIDEMEMRGATIAPFAMNLPDQADLLSEDEIADLQREISLDNHADSVAISAIRKDSLRPLTERIGTRVTEEAVETQTA